MSSNDSSDETPRCCDRCGRELHPGSGDFFIVRIDAVADPTPPSFTWEDFHRDASAEIEALLSQMRDLSEQEALDQVYRRLVIWLCNACFGQWIEDPAGRSE
jgi:hypothetical protein